MCVQNLKFVVLPVPEIIRGSIKPWAVSGYAHAPFLQNFSALLIFYSDGPCECTCQSFILTDPVNVPANLNSVASPVPDIIGGIQKIGQSLHTATIPILQNS